jgi:hypothetical protein
MLRCHLKARFDGTPRRPQRRPDVAELQEAQLHKRTPAIGIADWTRLAGACTTGSAPYPGVFTFLDDWKIMPWASVGRRPTPGRRRSTERFSAASRTACRWRPWSAAW